MNAVIKIRLSDTGRKSDILAGGNGELYQEIVILREAPEFPEVVQIGKIDGDRVVLDRTDWQAGSWDAIPTARQVLEKIKSDSDQEAAKQAAEESDFRVKCMEVLTNRRTKSDYAFDFPVPDWPYSNDIRCVEVLNQVVSLPESQAWITELDAAKQAAKDAALKAKQEKEEADRIANEEKAAKEAARRETLGLRDGDDDYRVENGALMQVPCYENHKRGKNWFAVIEIDPKSPGGLKRDFADKAKGDAFYMLPSLSVGDAVEFGGDYYSGSGRKSADRWYGYVVRVTDEMVVLHKCVSGKDAVKAGKKYAETTNEPATVG